MVSIQHNWSPLLPGQVQQLLADLNVPWWLAGGWAIDLFIGHQTRDHADIDVLILRSDQLILQTYLADWELYKTNQPGLKRWKKDEFLPPGINDIWCRRNEDSDWSLQFMLMETEGDEWIFRRLPAVRGLLSELGIMSESGICYLRPEIQLLYKARPEISEKDQSDFDLVLPLLTCTAQSWLLEKLSLQFPLGHRWIEQLRENL